MTCRHGPGIVICDGMAWCTACGDVDERRLYARISAHRSLCSRCWRAAGEPSPVPMALDQVHVSELEARRRMLSRGGADAHLVRKGVS